MKEVIKKVNNKWPTIEGRLKHSFKDRGEGLKQMRDRGDILTLSAERELKRYIRSMDI